MLTFDCCEFVLLCHDVLTIAAGQELEHGKTSCMDEHVHWDVARCVDDARLAE